jgi:hypothetical protein
LVDKTQLQVELAALPSMRGAALRQRWLQLIGQPAPRLGSMLLRHALAWELQARVHGGLSPRTQRRLMRAANVGAQHRSIAGMTLVREWKGVLHTITIDENETVHWNGQTWNSLTEVARQITGTRWLGSVFFGLKQKADTA